MRCLTLAVLLAAASPAMAETFPLRLCAKVAETARAIMDGRQKGVPMEDAIEIAEQGGDARDLAIVMVTSAYDRPRWYSVSLQRREVEDFGETFYKACYKAAR